MNFKDIHTDLDTEISPFPKAEKKELSAGILGEVNTSDIKENLASSISIGDNKNIKISNQKKINIFKKNKYFDGINLLKKNKDVDISQPYINKTEELTQGIKNSSEHIKINAVEFYDNNLKKKNHNFKQKRLVKGTSGFSFSGKNIVNKYNQSPLIKQISLGIIFLFLFLFGLKSSIEYSVNSGYQNLTKIKNGEIAFDDIQKTINDSHFSFVYANFLFTPISLIPNESIQNAYHVIQGGKQVTLLGDEFLQFIEGLQVLIDLKGIDGIYTSQVLENSKDKFLNFEYILSKALVNYDKITQIGDTQLQNTFDNTVTKLHQTLRYIKTINLNFDEFLSLMGHYQERKYLIVFQNNDEIRPTGGFMGSMGVVTVYKGKVVSIEKSDVYKYEWEINKTYSENNVPKILAPKGLDQITGTWGLRDSNYDPFIEGAADDIRSFLTKINVELDGIIFINKSTIEEIIRISGGIDFDDLDMKITDENFSRVISTLVEAKTSKVGTLGTPKQVLFDFAEEFYIQMKENKDYIPYAKVIFNHLQSRDIIIYSFHPDENSLLWKLNLNGELAFHKTLDFTYPVYTSLSGNKSDRYITTEYNKTVDVVGECSFETNLEIQRKHTYNNLEEAKIDTLLNRFNIEDTFQIKKIQGKSDNYQYMRIYLPKNAEVTVKEGMNIEYFDRYIMIDFFMTTRLYETTDYNIEYTINKDNCNGYSYKMYKQPGITDYNMNITINGEEISAKQVKKDFIINR